MTESLKLVPFSALRPLIDCIIPQKIKPGCRLEFGISLRDAGLEFNSLSHFVRLIDRCYGHLSPGGIDRYLSDQEEKLRITYIKQGTGEWVISKELSDASQAQALIMLFLMLKCLPELKGFSKRYTNTSGEALPNEKRDLLLAKTHIRVQRKITGEAALKGLSDECRTEISHLLSDLYLREYRLLNSAIRFSKTCVRDVAIKVHLPMEKKTDVKGRVYLDRPIMATLVQDGRSYASQMIEYSSNGAGLSLLILDITQDKKEKIVHNTQDISIRFGSKKCTGSIIHQTERGIGLFLGIQLRYPVQNWATILN